MLFYIETNVRHCKFEKRIKLNCTFYVLTLPRTILINYIIVMFFFTKHIFYNLYFDHRNNAYGNCTILNNECHDYMHNFGLKPKFGLKRNKASDVHMVLLHAYVQFNTEIIHIYFQFQIKNINICIIK